MSSGWSITVVEKSVDLACGAIAITTFLTIFIKQNYFQLMKMSLKTHFLK